MRKLVGLTAACSIAVFSFSVNGLEYMKKLAAGDVTLKSLSSSRNVGYDLKDNVEEESEPARKKRALGASRRKIEAQKEESSLVDSDSSDEEEDVSASERSSDEQDCSKLQSEEFEGLEDLEEEGEASSNVVDFGEIDSEIREAVDVAADREDCGCPDKVENVQDLIRWIRYSKEQNAKLDIEARDMIVSLVETLNKLGMFEGVEQGYLDALQHCREGAFKDVVNVCSRCLECMDEVWGSQDVRNRTPRSSEKKRRRSFSGEKTPGSKSSSCNVTPSGKKAPALVWADGVVDTGHSNKAATEGKN